MVRGKLDVSSKPGGSFRRKVVIDLSAFVGIKKSIWFGKQRYKFTEITRLFSTLMKSISDVDFYICDVSNNYSLDEIFSIFEIHANVINFNSEENYRIWLRTVGVDIHFTIDRLRYCAKSRYCSEALINSFLEDVNGEQ